MGTSFCVEKIKGLKLRALEEKGIQFKGWRKP